MVINHNLSALNAKRNMGINNNSATKAMEKLSSGLKINRAGDNAAGLSISEKMRGQIRGLNQAATNAEDGISLIQTAEGALNETHSILQRMKELANQSSNDTNADVDREAIQEEMNQLTSEINRIGNTTEFNTKKLLNGSIGNAASKELAAKGLKTWWLKEGYKLAKDTLGMGFGPDTKITVFLDESNDDPNQMASLGYTVGDRTHPGDNKNLQLRINMSKFTSLKETDLNGDGGNIYLDRNIAHELTHGIMVNQIGSEAMSSLPGWFKEGVAEAIHGADRRVNAELTNGATVSQLIDRLQTTGRATDSKDYSAGYIAVRYLTKNSSSDAVKNMITQIKEGKNIDQAISSLGISGVGNLEELKSKMKTELNAASNEKAFLRDNANIILNNDDTGALLGADATGDVTKELTADSVVPETGTYGDLPTGTTNMGDFEVIWPEITGGDGISLQIGANEGQSLTLELSDMRASALGLTKSSAGDPNFTSELAVTNGTDSNKTEYALDVTDGTSAKKAITIISDAITKVSKQRSSLGAYQNRLEHTINNLGTSSENLTSAESRIRDTDMASEMSEYSKNNILQQAAQAMLAQAKSAPQSVLQLLQ